MIGERLRAERERLGFTQQQFAEAAASAKRTLIEWEKGATSPTVVQLSALSAVGVDVCYVLTGQRTTFTAPSLSPREEALLNNYRHSGEEGKRAVEATATALARKEGEPKKSRGG